jgi:hypothetical protein
MLYLSDITDFFVVNFGMRLEIKMLIPKKNSRSVVLLNLIGNNVS